MPVSGQGQFYATGSKTELLGKKVTLCVRADTCGDYSFLRSEILLGSPYLHNLQLTCVYKSVVKYVLCLSIGKLLSMITQGRKEPE